MVDSIDAAEPGNGEAQTGDPFPILKSLQPQLRLKVLFVKAGLTRAGSGSGRDPQTAQAAIAELNKLGLVATYVPDDHGGVIRFSNNKEDTNLVTALGGGKDHGISGALYGIPQTAMKAFPDNTFKTKEIPEEIKNDPLSNALYFRPSRDHWREEWAEFRERALRVRQTMPTLVNQLNLDHLYTPRPTA